MLDVREKQHGRKVGDGGHGQNGRLEVGMGPVIAGEARRKVRRRGEKHIPGEMWLAEGRVMMHRLKMRLMGG